jgi:hypothetical protein
MDEVIYSASGPPSCVASMDEVIHSAPWRPWMKSSIVPAALPPVWRPWMKSPAIVPAALSYLSFQAASRWTKTVIPNLWLRRTRGIWRGRRICRRRFGAEVAAAAAAAAAAEAEAAAAACCCKLEQILLQSWLKRLQWVWRDSIPWQIIIQGPTNRSGRPARKMRMLIGTVTRTHYELIAWIRYMNSWYELIQWRIHTMNSYAMN